MHLMRNYRMILVVDCQLKCFDINASRYPPTNDGVAYIFVLSIKLREVNRPWIYVTCIKQCWQSLRILLIQVIHLYLLVITNWQLFWPLLFTFRIYSIFLSIDPNFFLIMWKWALSTLYFEIILKIMKLLPYFLWSQNIKFVRCVYYEKPRGVIFYHIHLTPIYLKK